MDRKAVQDYAEKCYKDYMNDNSVSVTCSDGSFFFLLKSRMEEKDNWIIVYTEHFGILIFDRKKVSMFHEFV